MAQDFFSAFGLGKGETTLATVDVDGVALAAIKALATENKQLEKDALYLKNKIEDLQSQIDELKSLILKIKQDNL